MNKQNYDQHQVHTSIQGVKALIGKITEEIPEKANTEIIIKVFNVITYIENILSNASIDFLVQNTLDSITNNVIQVSSNLTGYINTKNEAHFVQIPPYLDAIISLSTQIVLEKRRNGRFVQINNEEIIKNIENSFSTIIIEERKQLDDFKETIDEIQKSLSSQLKEINAEKSRLDRIIALIQQQFSQSETIRNNQNQEGLAQFKLDTDKKIKELETKITTMIKKNEDAFSGHEKYLLAKKEEAARIVQIISNIGFSGNYHNIADKERKNSNWLRIIAIGIMLVFSVFAVLTLLDLHNPSISWQASLLKIFSISLLTVPFTYVSRESTKHRKLEQQYRKMELELSSIDAFIETLPVEKRVELKTEITQRLFGSTIEVNDKGEEDVISSNFLMKILEEVRKLIK
jgi:hypothetical protein